LPQLVFFLIIYHRYTTPPYSLGTYSFRVGLRHSKALSYDKDEAPIETKKLQKELINK
jgi:hypothetical protein